MTTDGRLLTPAELAERFQVTVTALHRWRREFDWPYVRLGRAIRFTEEQVEQITRRHMVEGSVRFLLPGQLHGQTYLSARRHRTSETRG